MWSHERQSRILEELSRDGKVYTNRLADLLEVSRETIRRDFLELEECGNLRRVHGGAVLSDREIPPEPAFSDRMTANAEAKRAIGRHAAGLVPPGSTLFIDAGTTTLAFAHELLLLRDIRIITNSIEIAQLVAPHDTLEVLLLGGKPHVEVPATYGELTLSEIDRFLADFAVISPVAFDATRGATDYELHEAEVARKMIRCSRSCIMLCHADKLSTESRVAICRPEEVDHLVTDVKADPRFALPRGQVHFAAEDEAAPR
ncbi:DeoR/GlpR family DNA-binding transcription regulator [Celeribacter indicus]|uniref:DeoR family transcriptional regulator n=1 Tax=Celeribacter indicus TaxID=1208324 RepID=A0A0B5E3E0_9RHOB|nr:DeoR/GlpR family DNA-binding transcription regulator [Celeribacter indicus]AJE47571.1 DeoR family transcriptional regulator [Celeribacter indicus]SDW10562.1 transcriptional regulator, DeoR family [Celeribacter indicus]